MQQVQKGGVNDCNPQSRWNDQWSVMQVLWYAPLLPERVTWCTACPELGHIITPKECSSSLSAFLGLLVSCQPCFLAKHTKYQARFENSEVFCSKAPFLIARRCMWCTWPVHLIRTGIHGRPKPCHHSLHPCPRRTSASAFQPAVASTSQTRAFKDNKAVSLSTLFLGNL